MFLIFMVAGQAITTKPTQEDRDQAALVTGEARKDSESSQANGSHQQQASTSPTVVYVNPPAPSPAVAVQSEAPGSWSKFLSSSLLSAAFAMGLSSVARSMEWSRTLLDPGAREREAALERRRREEAEVLAEARAAQAAIRQQQQQHSAALAQNSGARCVLGVRGRACVRACVRVCA